LYVTPASRIRLHTYLAWVWLGLTVVTTAWAVWMPDSKLLMGWLIAMSGYAIVSTHWAAREGAAPSAEEDEV
jgi:hypothetical protein